MPSSSSSQGQVNVKGQEVKLDVIQLDSQGGVNVAIQSSSTWGVDNTNTNMIGVGVGPSPSASTSASASAPRIDTITEVYIMNMLKTKANVSLLISPNQGYIKHLIDVSVGSCVLDGNVNENGAGGNPTTSYSNVEEIYVEGLIDWFLSSQTSSSTTNHLTLQQNVRYPASNLDVNVLGNVEYNDSSISLSFSNRDQSGVEVVSGHLLSLYDVQSAPSSW